MHNRRMAWLFTLAIAASGLAQTPPSKTRVEVRVLNRAGGPLGNATVTLMGDNRTPAAPIPPSYTAASNASGEVVFEDVEPNTYRLFVRRTGYLEFVFAEPDSTVSIPLVEGQQRRIELRMTAPSFLSGTVTDESGEPFLGAKVVVYSVVRNAGKRRLRPLGPVTAGRDGTFSSASLPAGRYVLAASAQPSMTESNQREVRTGKTGAERYVATFYPSSLDAASATLIDLPAETDLRNLDVQVRKARVFHINGKVLNAAGAVVPRATVNWRDPSMSDPLNNANSALSADGSFVMNGLLPGTYAVQAWSSSRDQQGHQLVTVTDHDIDDLALRLVPSIEIPLTVSIQGVDDPRQADTMRQTLGRFTLTATDALNDNAMAQAKDDGWIFRRIGPGTFRLGLTTPEGAYVKSIRYGDEDVTFRELDTTLGQAALEVVLSAHAAEASGVVHDAMGNPLPGIAVTLWPPGMPAAGTLDQSRNVMTDAKGAFRIGRLRPGDYRIAAWEKIEPGLAVVPEFRVHFENEALTVKLSEDSHSTVQPPLIGRDRVESEAANLP